MTVRKNILIIVVFIATVLTLFINKLTTPRTLSANELLVNGLFLFEQPKPISDFVFYTSDGEFTKADVDFYEKEQSRLKRYTIAGNKINFGDLT